MAERAAPGARVRRGRAARRRALLPAPGGPDRASVLDPAARPAAPAASRDGWLCGAVGPALAHLRRRRDRRQADVAAAAGLTRNQLSAFERGRARPSLDTLERLLEVLGCDLPDLQEALDLVAGRPRRRRAGPRIRLDPARAAAYMAELIDMFRRLAAEIG